jgi:predicted PurR-regulated permease PerM
VFIGVIGGILAFGFVGVFIGPALLALALRLWQVWIEREEDPQREGRGPAAR